MRSQRSRATSPFDDVHTGETATRHERAGRHAQRDGRGAAGAEAPEVLNSRTRANAPASSAAPFAGRKRAMRVRELKSVMPSTRTSVAADQSPSPIWYSAPADCRRASSDSGTLSP